MAKHIHTPNRYLPPYPIPPGATIRDFLNAAGMSQAELAQRMGRPEQAISEIINAKKSIIEDTAIQLECVLGVPADFWLSLEQSYKETRARVQEQRELERQTSALRRFPYREMVRRGYFEDLRDRSARVLQWLKFLRVSSFEALENYINVGILTFHRSPTFSLPYEKLAVWFRLGELEFEKRELEKYDPDCLKSSLNRIRSLSLNEPDEATRNLIRICADCGVAVIIIKGFTGLPVYGVTRWINKTPIIQMSFRQRTIDFVWFALFHEFGHILLHSNQKIIIDTDKKVSNDPLEDEANRFAQDQLIPPERFAELVSAGQPNREAIIDYANELKIHPGIIVGRLHYDKVIPYDWYNDLREKFDVPEDG